MMRRLGLLLVLGIFCNGMLSTATVLSSPATDLVMEETDKNKEKVKIDVDAVKGEKEKADALEAQLESLDGVYKVKVCHYRGMAKIKYNPDRVSIEDFTEIIEEAGYAYSVR